MAVETPVTEPCTIIIFGVTGHLSKNKLLPALYHLEIAGRLPKQVTITGFGRRDWTDEQWVEEVRNELSKHARGGLDEEVVCWIILRKDNSVAFADGDFLDVHSQFSMKESGKRISIDVFCSTH